MKLLIIFLNISSLSIWCLANNDLVPKVQSQCARALDTPRSLVEHFAEQSKPRSAQLKEWASFTSADKHSAISEAMEAIKVLSNMNTSKGTIELSNVLDWQQKGRNAFDRLKGSEPMIDKALVEIDQTLHEETLLIEASQKTWKNDSASQDQEKKTIALRLLSLKEIRSQLAKQRAMLPDLYLQLRNLIDLAHPYFSNPGMDQTRSKIFWVEPSSINMGAEAGKSSLGFEISSFIKNGLNYFESVSLHKKHELAKATVTQRLQNYLVPAEALTEFNLAIKRFAPWIQSLSEMVGQEIELIHFPNTWSPKAKFRISSFDRDSGNLQVVLPTGGKVSYQASWLFQHQIQYHLLHDVRRLIEKDQPVLVYTDGLNQMSLMIITEVSLTDMKFRGVKLDSEQIHSEWISFSALRGIPLQVTATENPLAAKIQPFGYGRLIPDEIETTLSDENKLIIQFQEAGTLSFRESTDRAGDGRSEANLQSSLLLSPNLKESRASLTEKIDALLLQLEPNGYYKERALKIIELMRHQAWLLNESAMNIDQMIKVMDDWYDPSWLNHFRSQEKRSKHYQTTLGELPAAISQSRAILKNHLTSDQQAEVLLREILEVLEKYKTIMPTLTRVAEGDPVNKDSLKLFFSERVVLLTKIVQKIDEDRKKFQKSRYHLGETLHQATIVAEENHLKIPVVSIYIDETNSNFTDWGNLTSELLKPLIYSGQDYGTLLKQILTEDVKSLTEKFAPNPEVDFPLTFKFAETLSQLKMAMLIYQSEIPEFSFESVDESGNRNHIIAKYNDINSTYYFKVKAESLGAAEIKMASVDLIKMLNKGHRRIFKAEFQSFMNKHRVLFSPIDNRVILKYDSARDEFTLLSRDGRVATTKLSDVPIWRYEKIPVGVGFRKYRQYPKQYLGFGHTFDGERIYFERGLGPNNEDSYQQEKIKESFEIQKVLEEGDLIPETTLRFDEEVVLVNPTIAKSLQDFMDKEMVDLNKDQALKIDIKFLSPFIRVGKPVAVSNAEKIIFLGRIQNQRFDEFQVGREKLKELEIHQLGTLGELQDQKAKALMEKAKSYRAYISAYWLKVPVGEGKSAYLMFGLGRASSIVDWSCDAFLIWTDGDNDASWNAKENEP